MNAGAIDDVAAIGAVVRELCPNAWFHIDGAYGGLFSLALPWLRSEISRPSWRNTRLPRCRSWPESKCSSARLMAEKCDIGSATAGVAGSLVAPSSTASSASCWLVVLAMRPGTERARFADYMERHGVPTELEA